MAIWRAWTVLSVAAILAALAGVALLPTPRSSAQVEQGATMTVLRGQVAVVRSDGSAVQPAPSGTTVNSGDEIRTLGSTSALITFFAGTELELDQNTVIAIEEVSRQGDRIDISLKQAFGTTVNRVQTLAGSGSTYRIDAGGAVALVRGTTFVVIGPITTSSGTDIVILVCGADCTSVSTFAGCPLGPFVGYGVQVAGGQVVSPCMMFAVSRTSDLTSMAYEALTTIEQQVQGDTDGVPAGQVQSGQQQEIESRNRRRPEDDDQIVQPIAPVPSPGALPTASILDSSASEGTGVTFTVVLSSPSSQPVTIFYTTQNGTAIAPVDYTAATGFIVIPPGATTGQIVVPTVADGTGAAAGANTRAGAGTAADAPAGAGPAVASGSIVSRGTVTAAAVEPPETFFVNLTGANGAAIGDGLGQGTIVDPTALTISINDPLGVTEGTVVRFTVSMSAASSQPVTVTYSTANGTAVAPGDYTVPSGTLTIPAGATSGQIDVQTVADGVVEPPETFVVNLTATTVGALNPAEAQGVGTIVDPGTLTFSINDPSAAEGSPVTFTVTLSAASSQTVTVDFATGAVGSNPATGGACATAGIDYASQSGTLTFNPGVTSQPIAVATCPDALDELPETFAVNLSNAVNASAPDMQGVGTITDDDPPPSISIDDVEVDPEGTGSNPIATFTASLSAASGRVVTVDFVVGASVPNPATGGAACSTSGVDYVYQTGTLTFPVGSTAQPINVTVCGDNLDELDETFAVTLSNPSPPDTPIPDTQGIGTIRDDDTSVFSVSGPDPMAEGNECSQEEGSSDGSPLVFPPCGTTDFPFVVTLSPASDRPMQVRFETANGGPSNAATGGGTGTCAEGSSDDGIDYEIVVQTLTFNPGDGPKTINVKVCADQAFFWGFDEENENFFVHLRVPPVAGGTIVSTAEAIIVEDDDEDFGSE